MPYIMIIFILIIVVSFLIVKLCMLKRQLREMSLQLHEQEEGTVSVDFVDKDLEELALHINEKLELLQKTKVDAAQNEQSMKTAISMISHDMRTPLTSVIGYLQLAEKSCADEETLQDIRIALERAKYSNKLVDDFFELSVVDSNQYTPVMEKINICDMVCEEILAHYLAFEKRGISPCFEQSDEEIYVWADRKLLSRVIQNLISNSIKYSTGKIEFLITENTDVTLTVTNSVSEEIDTERIFEKFYRTDASRKGDGAGLGLYICRKLVEEMGGDISAETVDDRLKVNVNIIGFKYSKKKQ